MRIPSRLEQNWERERSWPICAVSRGLSASQGPFSSNEREQILRGSSRRRSLNSESVELRLADQFVISDGHLVDLVTDCENALNLSLTGFMNSVETAVRLRDLWDSGRLSESKLTKNIASSVTCVTRRGHAPRLSKRGPSFGREFPADPSPDSRILGIPASRLPARPGARLLPVVLERAENIHDRNKPSALLMLHRSRLLGRTKNRYRRSTRYDSRLRAFPGSSH